MMIADIGGAGAAALHEDRVAELTSAAYCVALRHGATTDWLDLQLELWRAFSTALAHVRVAEAARGVREELTWHAEEWLAELSDVAYRIVLPRGRRSSFLVLELELYQALCRVVERAVRQRA